MNQHLTAKPFVLILGPCSLESRETAFRVAEVVGRIASANPEVRVFFKGSFDKANRTSIESPRGPGLEEGLELFAEIGKELGLRCLTDVHLPEQAVRAAAVVDVLQIPAFLCRQTDLLVAAAGTGRIVNVKKGQFLSPYDMEHVVRKLENARATEVWQTERGTTFGYQNLVVDMRSFQVMESFGHQTLFDATHSVQMPGAGKGTTSGKREFIPRLALAAIGAGAGGLFMETHPEPSKAISDGPNQVPLDELEPLVQRCLDLRAWLNEGR